MDTHGKPRSVESAALAQLRDMRREQEQRALHAYGKALQQQERTSCKLEETREDLEETNARLEQRRLDGADPEEINQLQARCHDLHQTRCQWEQATRKARQDARQAFAALLKARHAKATLDRMAHESPPAPCSFPALLSLTQIQQARPFWN